MKVRLIIKIFSLSALALLSACGELPTQGYLDSIPAQSSGIVAIDLDQALKMTGCGSKGGVISLTPDLSNLLERVDTNALFFTQAIAAQGHWLDLSQTYALKMPNSSQWIWTAPVREEMSMPSNYSSATKSEILHRAYFYPISSHTTMVAIENQAFFLKPDSAIKRIEELVTMSRTSSLGNNPHLKEFFQGTPQVKARFMINQNDNPAGQPFDEIRATLTIRERTLALRAAAYLKSSPVNPISQLLPIDPEALDWMPNGCIAAAAIGVSPQVLLDASKMVHNMQPNTHLALNTLIAMLDAHGGTISLGAAPGGNAETIKNLTLENWQLKSMLPMGEKAEPAAMIIDKFVEGLYSETVDDYLAITNYNPEDYPSEYDAWPATVFGAKALLTATIPYKSQTMKALKFKNGYEFKIVAADSMAQTTLRLLGTGDYLAPAMVRDALQIIR